MRKFEIPAGAPPPMKEAELRAHATCDLCNRPIGHTGVPLFWRVRVDRFGVDLNAVRAQGGLAAMLGGNAALASAMGTDPDMGIPVMPTVTLTACESCGINRGRVRHPRRTRIARHRATFAGTS